MPEDEKLTPDTEDERIDDERLEDVYDESDEDDDDEDDDPVVIPKIKQFLSWFWRFRKRTIPVAVGAVLLVVFSVPVSRYAVLGLVIKRDLPVIIKDNVSGLPVSDVKLSFRGQEAMTDGGGRARFKDVPVGYGDIQIEKAFYDSKQQRIIRGLSAPKGDYEITIQTNGLQIPIKVVNKITGQSLADVAVRSGEISTTTDQNGEATLVIPPNQTQADVAIEHPGYNLLNGKAVVSQQVVDENTFALIPEGKVYFLSRRSGRVNVMKSNLDGSGAKTIIKATGQEDPDDMALLATKDWRYLALKARRQGDRARLYLIDTKTEKIVEIDGADDVSIRPIGWSGNNFVYIVDRTEVSYWKSKRTALKSFDATNQAITLIDENDSKGSGEYSADYENFSNVILAGDKVVYGKYWQINSYRNIKDRKATLYTAALGQKPETIQQFSVKEDKYGNYYNFLDLNKSSPIEVLVHYSNDGASQHYSYEVGATLKEIKERAYNKAYPVFLKSPGGQNALWHEERDGKNTIFVGDQNGKNGKVIATSSEYTPYGWLTDDYILVTKDNSELYIMPSNGTGGLGDVVKITNYHRPAGTYRYDGL